MPSGPKKRKSAKRKKNAFASPAHQRWLLSHLQMLRIPSLENGTKGKEKKNREENEFWGNGDRGEAREGKDKLSPEFIGDEAATPRDMDSSENGGSRVVCMDDAENPSQVGESQKVENLKRLSLDTSAEELGKAGNLECAASNILPEELANKDGNVHSGNGLKADARERKNIICVGVDKSLNGVITLPVEVSVPSLEGKVEAGTLALAVDCSASGEDETVILDANESVEAPHDDENDGIAQKIEIPHPPMVVHRASVWNCCGLLEVFMDSQK